MWGKLHITTDAAVSGITKRRLFDGRRCQRVKQMEPFRLGLLQQMRFNNGAAPATQSPTLGFDPQSAEVCG
jgi:hypothetical protein